MKELEKAAKTLEIWLWILIISVAILIISTPVFVYLEAKNNRIIDKLQEEYNTLQTQYYRDLSTCRTLLSDLQNRVQKGPACYVDGGLNCE